MKTFLSFFLCMNIFVGFAQRLEVKGVGELKVGETKISFIDDVAAKTKKKIKRLPDFSSSDDAHYQKFIVEYVKPLSKCSDAGNPLIPEHRVFVIYDYAIMDQYPTPRLFLEFYNDVLYRFTVDEPQFMTELRSKYGEPVTDEILHNSNCAKEAGVSANMEKDIIQSWDYGDIHAAYVTAESRTTGGCDKVLKTRFEVNDLGTHKIVQVLENEALKKCQAGDEKEKTVNVPGNF